MEILFQPEISIDDKCSAEITNLRNECFPNHAVGRPYLKQLPHFRCLLYLEGKLVAHLGIDHRVVRIEKQYVRIFGIIDLCVRKEFRNSGYATILLNHVTEIAVSARVDFLLLIATNHDLYLKNGFQIKDEAITFLHIRDLQSVEISTMKENGTLMIKEIQDMSWPQGDIDMLGYLF